MPNIERISGNFRSHTPVEDPNSYQGTMMRQDQQFHDTYNHFPTPADSLHYKGYPDGILPNEDGLSQRQQRQAYEALAYEALAYEAQQRQIYDAKRLQYQQSLYTPTAHQPQGPSSRHHDTPPHASSSRHHDTPPHTSSSTQHIIRFGSPTSDTLYTKGSQETATLFATRIAHERTTNGRPPETNGKSHLLNQQDLTAAIRTGTNPKGFGNQSTNIQEAREESIEKKRAYNASDTGKEARAAYKASYARKAKIDDYEASYARKAKIDDYEASYARKAKIDDYKASYASKAKIDDYKASYARKAKIDDYESSDARKAKIDDYRQKRR